MIENKLEYFEPEVMGDPTTWLSELIHYRKYTTQGIEMLQILLNTTDKI